MKAFHTLVFVGLVMGCSTSTWAWRDIVCKNATVERKIEVIYSEASKKVPCQVKYTKESSSGAPVEQILFSAQVQAGYCEEKATEFAGQLSVNGWSCSQVESN